MSAAKSNKKERRPRSGRNRAATECRTSESGKRQEPPARIEDIEPQDVPRDPAATSDVSDVSDLSDLSDASDLSDLSDVSDLSDKNGTDEAEPGASAQVPRHRTPRLKNPAEAKVILECLLFAATEPLSIEELRRSIHPIKAKALQALLVELQNEYDARGSGLQIVQLAGGYQMATRPRYADWLAPLQRRRRRTGLSVALLETLAIIAYKQPIIRAEIDAIRGVDSSGVIHALAELGLIEVVGQKQVPGRPHLFGTTKAFLQHFGLKNLSDLPSIESLRERFELARG